MGDYMKNFHIKSLILGIGIGIVLSSIIGLIYSFGYSAAEPAKMTKDQIITEAKKYGMVDDTSIFNSNQTVDKSKTGGN